MEHVLNNSDSQQSNLMENSRLNLLSIADKKKSTFVCFKFAFTLGLAAALWLIIPLRYPLVVKSWTDNELLPGCFLWISIFAGITIWGRRRLVVDLQSKTVPQGVIAAAVLFSALWLHSLPPYLSHYIFIFATGALLLGMGGKSWLRVCLPALIILFYLSGPAPQCYDFFVNILQTFSALIAGVFSKVFLTSECFLDGFNLHLFKEGVADFQTTPMSFYVAPECSGYRSLYGLTLLAVFYCSSLKIQSSRKLMLFFLAILLAVSVNLLRIILCISSRYYGGPDLISNGFGHSVFGQVVMLVEALILNLMWRKFLKTKTY